MAQALASETPAENTPATRASALVSLTSLTSAGVANTVGC